jgi:uncharacterized protein (TIGR03435 family)
MLRKVCTALFAVLASVIGYGQELKEGDRPAFEVVSVKPSGTNTYVMYGSGMVKPHTFPFRYSGQHLTCDLSLREIIGEAFSVKDFQIAGSGWMATQTYEIAALMPPGTTKDRARLMLQTMLEERFGLRFHREQKDLPAYALEEARGGFKLRPVDPEQAMARAKDRIIETAAGPQRGVTMAEGPGRFTKDPMSIGEFADWLAHYMDAPVVNMTDIKGVYEIDLRWSQDTDPEGGAPRRNDPELLGVIERQLGLRVQKSKLPLDILVIDHVEKAPTEN